MILLRPIESLSDISPEVRGTPIEDLLRYPNLGAIHSPYSQAEVLVGMCMDHRERLSFPENFAYTIRSAGCNLRYSEFQISYAVAIGGISAIALVGHTNCGMVNLMNRLNSSSPGWFSAAGGARVGRDPLHEFCIHV